MSKFRLHKDLIALLAVVITLLILFFFFR